MNPPDLLIQFLGSMDTAWVIDDYDTQFRAIQKAFSYHQKKVSDFAKAIKNGNGEGKVDDSIYKINITEINK